MSAHAHAAVTARVADVRDDATSHFLQLALASRSGWGANVQRARHMGLGASHKRRSVRAVPLLSVIFRLGEFFRLRRNPRPLDFPRA